jgi:hypothetical protein
MSHLRPDTADYAVLQASAEAPACHAAFLLAGMVHPGPVTGLPERWLAGCLTHLRQALSRRAISKPTSTRRSI